MVGQPEMPLQKVHKRLGSNARRNRAIRPNHLGRKPRDIRHGHENGKVVAHRKLRIDRARRRHHISRRAPHAIFQKVQTHRKKPRARLEAIENLPAPPRINHRIRLRKPRLGNLLQKNTAQILRIAQLGRKQPVQRRSTIAPTRKKQRPQNLSQRRAGLTHKPDNRARPAIVLAKNIQKPAALKNRVIRPRRRQTPIARRANPLPLFAPIKKSANRILQPQPLQRIAIRIHTPSITPPRKSARSIPQSLLLQGNSLNRRDKRMPAFVGRCFDRCNGFRPHSALDGLSPDQHCAGDQSGRAAWITDGQGITLVRNPVVEGPSRGESLARP